MPSFERKGIFSDKLLLSPARDVLATCRVRLQDAHDSRPRTIFRGCSPLKPVCSAKTAHSTPAHSAALPTALSASMIETRQSRPVTHKGRTRGRLTLGVDEFPFLVSSDSR